MLAVWRKAGDQGLLYGSVTTMDIADELKAKGYADVREGYTLEYCATASVDLYGVMHRAAVELAG